MWGNMECRDVFQEGKRTDEGTHGLQVYFCRSGVQDLFLLHLVNVDSVNVLFIVPL